MGESFYLSLLRVTHGYGKYSQFCASNFNLQGLTIYQINVNFTGISRSPLDFRQLLWLQRYIDSKPKLRHRDDFSPFLSPKPQSPFFWCKIAIIPQLIDSDGRALHKDSESGPNSKITKITNMTFLQNPAEMNLPKP